MEKIIIEASKYLSRDVYGFCHAKYYRRGNPMSTTGFLTDLKNDISYVSPEMLAQAEQELADVLTADFQKLVDAFGPLMVCGIPRAKHEGYYRNDQMGLRRVISKVAQANPMLEDGTSYIVRHTDTVTTHRAKWGYGGSGEMPRPGLLKDTCNISGAITGKNVLLVDDIFTPGVGIDEDGIQAMFDAGAENVIFYAVARAGGNMAGFRLCA